MPGILARRIQANAASPNDESVWTSTGPDGLAGVLPTMAGSSVTSETAMRLSGVYACVDLISRVLAMIPLKLYKSVPAADGQNDKRPSTNPLRNVLAYPNDDQSRFELVYEMTARALFRRYSCAEIIRERGRAVALYSLDPNRLARERIAGTRRYRYLYKEQGANAFRTILSEDVLKVPGAAVLDYARESFGFAQAVQTFGSRSFARGVRPSGFIAHEPTVTYTEDAKIKIKEAIESNHSGAARAGGVLMLPEGLKWNQLGMTNEQAEFAATTTFSVVECARWFAVPPYKVNVTEAGAMSFASVEAQGIDLAIYTFLPWAVRWEGALEHDLIDEPDEFAEFLMDAVMRGTTKERFDAYAVGIQWGFMSPQQARRLENWNSVPGLDVFLRPLNMTPAASAAARDASIATSWAAIADESPAARLAKLFAHDAAGRMARREVAAIAKLATKHANDPAAFVAAARDFYRQHAPVVADALKLPAGAAESYANAHLEKLRTDGPEVAAAWESEPTIDDLAQLALTEGTR